MDNHSGMEEYFKILFFFYLEVQQGGDIEIAEHFHVDYKYIPLSFKF